MPRFYANPSPTYQPAMRLISGITNAVQPTITTTFDHDYLVGLLVRFYIPSEYGMVQLNHLTGQVLSVPTDATFTINIDTSSFDTFIAVAAPEPWYVNDTAHVVPTGEINSSLAQATRNVLT